MYVYIVKYYTNTARRAHSNVMLFSDFFHDEKKLIYSKGGFYVWR